ncbi:MAG: RpiB/LacA/LacB family sugar-phosphate isomerase, partial [Synergistaceae bacterium]|nr:RpiB/LacA/LacB family sugar-phosphate isomerase [Synergistaceae bacterium]
MRIAIGTDHAGFVLKSAAIDYLRSRKIEVIDLGAYVLDEEDSYTDPAFKVGGAVADGEADAGVLLCGTGYGISIAANKVPGIRAVSCDTPEHARIAKAHNDINVISLGGRTVKPESVPEILGTWLDTPFEGGRHLR